MEPSWAGRWVHADVIGWVVARRCTRRELWFPTPTNPVRPTLWTQTYSKRDRTFQYSPNTGTSALRGHIDHHHILEYLALAEANKWQVWLESVKATMARGYTLNEIWEALAEGGALALLPPRHSEASSTNSANPSDRPSIPPFSLEELHDHLVAFIVADDQVRDIYSHLIPRTRAITNRYLHSLLMSSNAKNSNNFYFFSARTSRILRSLTVQKSVRTSSVHGNDISWCCRLSWP
jgi:hypothetical protein